MTDVNFRDISIDTIENAFEEMTKRGEFSEDVVNKLKASVIRLRALPEPTPDPRDEGMIGYIFERGNDFIKFNYITGKNEYSSNEIEALWLDYKQKEANDECGPNGDYIAQEDIQLIEGFKGRRLY